MVVELSDVTFLDSTGIGALVELGRDAEDANAQFVISDPSPRVMRILEMTGLDSPRTLQKLADRADDATADKIGENQSEDRSKQRSDG